MNLRKYTLSFSLLLLFFQLNAQSEINPAVLALEAELQRLQDSITTIQNQLIGIIEAPEPNVHTKEKAVQVLASIHKEDVIEYLLKNETQLRFGKIDPIDDDYDGESARTAMLAIYEEYLIRSKVNWMVFPFLLKHIGEISYTEIGIIRELYGYDDERFEKPWLLLEFMYVNGSAGMKALVEFVMDEVNVQFRD